MREIGQEFNETLERIRAISSINIVIAGESARVRQKMPHRESSGNGFVLQFETWNVRANSGIQLEFSKFDQFHRNACSEGFCYRSDLK